MLAATSARSGLGVRVRLENVGEKLEEQFYFGTLVCDVFGFVNLELLGQLNATMLI